MGTRCRTLLLFTAVVSLAGGIAYAQDAPSLGDLARQQRQQKEKSKTASSKDASSPKVITNEQISGHASVALTPVATNGEKTDPPASSDSAKKSAEDWKSQIQDQKSQVVSLQSQVDALSESIRFAPGNCVANCVEWNEHQKEKQQQVERMQAQLEDQKKQLEEMQDSARKQGYGSAVYDP
ncbi:MAG: hypothetical protein WCC99_16975 [Candidatus Sulfotelmatobacter sp.]